MRALRWGLVWIAVGCGSSGDVPTGDSGTAVDSATDGAGSNALWPNEPAGLTKITESSFATLTEGGFTPYYTISVAQDASAPKSADSVAQVLYPMGFAGGDSPGLLELPIDGGPTTLYISFWVKLSANWSGHPTGTNKVMHFWIGGLNRMFFYYDGAGTNMLQPSIGLQGVVSNGMYANLLPNIVPTASVTRGQWQRWEVVMVASSNGAADGSLTWWVDGVKVASYDSIQFVSGAGSWELLKWDPTWGGLGGSVPADQTMQLDHLYLSGK